MYTDNHIKLTLILDDMMRRHHRVSYKLQAFIYIGNVSHTQRTIIIITFTAI